MNKTPITQCLSTKGELPLQGVQARGRIVGRLLEMQLEQRYRNPEDVIVEVVYTFALPWHAVLLGLEVELNGETLAGVVNAKTQARTDYEDALSEGDSAVLCTVNPDRTLTLELGNLLPGETCLVRLRYTQILQPQQDSLRLLLPATLAPRYGDPVRDGGYEPHAVPQVDPSVEYPFDIRIDIEGELSCAAISSPSHSVTLRKLSGVNGSFVQVALGCAAWLDRDFVLVFNGIGQGGNGLAAWDQLDPGQGVVMASFTPALPEHQTQPAALKVLVDCSGSMAGDSIQAARRALQRILLALQSGERYSLSRFGSTVEHRCRGLWKVTPATLTSARRWVEALKANLGGTEMRTAILSTLELGTRAAHAGAGAGQEPGPQADVLLITDGEIEAIDDVLQSIRRSHQRFFVVGIGSSVAEGLLRQLAESTGGSCEFVAPGENVEPAVLRLFHRMRAPKVQHARIEWPADCAVQAQGDLPRSLFAGDDVTVFAWLRAPSAEALSGPARLYGCIAGAAGETLLAEVRPRFIADEPNTLARLAAHQRYWKLRKGGDEAPAALTKQLPALAEKYQLVTDDTSLVLVKQRAGGEKAQEMPQLRKVKAMLAAGWGGHGSVEFGLDARVRCILSATPDLAKLNIRYGIERRDTENLQEDPMFFKAIIHKIKSMESRKPKHPTRTEKLRASMDGILIEPTPAETQKGLQIPAKSREFWNEGDSYTDDTTQWFCYVGLTPAGVVECLRINPNKELGYLHFICMELPLFVQAWLKHLILSGHPEEDVVATFKDLLLAHDFTFRQSDAKALRTPAGTTKHPPDALWQHMAHTLAGMTAECWPDGLLGFVEMAKAKQDASGAEKLQGLGE